jgi:hypothetical protein
MAHENESFEDNFSESPEPVDAKSAYVMGLRQEIEDKKIPIDALDDWLDVKFRNEAAVDNNIVWGRAIRAFTEGIATVDLASNPTLSRWHSINDGNTRFAIKVTSQLEATDWAVADVVGLYQKLQKYYSMPDLFEEVDLRRRIQECFYGGLVRLEYEYYVHQDDLGRLPDMPDLEDAVTFAGTETYIPTSGYTIGLRPFNPELPLAHYQTEMQPSEFIAEVQTNTLYNESLWDSIQGGKKLSNPMPYYVAATG